MKQITTNLFLYLMINIGLIWCATYGHDIEHILRKEESIIYLQGSNVILHCPDVISKASFKWTLGGRSLDYVQVNESNGAIQIKFPDSPPGVYICYATEQIEGQDLVTISSTNIAIARLEEWVSIDKVPRHEVKVGDPVTLTCDNRPKSIPVGQYSWYKDEPRAEVKESESIAIDQKGSLHFVYTEKGDDLKGAKYKCSISNKMLDEIKLGSPKKLYVKERADTVVDVVPSLLYNGTEDYTPIGKSAVLECIFSGYPVPKIKWFDTEKNPITSNERFKIEKWGRMLTIENVKEEDEGNYRCEGETKLDKIESTVYLNVSSKPIFLNEKSETIKVINNTMIMNCSTRSAKGESPSDPPIWLENGEQLKLNPGKYELKQGETELFVYNLTQPDDFRCFQCIISNSVGIIYRSACFTGNTITDDEETYVTESKIATRPTSSRASDVVSQINLGLLLGVIIGAMFLFVVAGVLSLLVCRRRRRKAKDVPQNHFYTLVERSENVVNTKSG